MARAQPRVAPANESIDVDRAAPLVAPIIVNWNQNALTVQTLESLRSQRYQPLQAIVVDNGSKDQGEALAKIKLDFPEVRTIANRENLGYAGACNVGIELGMTLGADYFLLLNNDVVLDPDAISGLVTALEEDRTAGAAGPLIYHAAPPDRVWFGGGRLISGFRSPVRHEHAGERFERHPDVPARRSAWLTGAAMLVRKEAIQDAGMMDVTYFLYWEDVDWSCRLRQLGYNLLFVSRARVWHQVGASSGRQSVAAQYYQERNRLLFVERWGNLPTRLAHWLKLAVRLSAARFGVGDFSRSGNARLQAYRDYLQRQFGHQGHHFG